MTDNFGGLSGFPLIKPSRGVVEFHVGFLNDREQRCFGVNVSRQPKIKFVAFKFVNQAIILQYLGD